MGDEEGPQDPFSALAASAVQVHEMVVSFENAGFSRKEAIFIVVEMLKAASQGEADVE